jgi:PAS domain S-box-containing protein
MAGKERAMAAEQPRGRREAFLEALLGAVADVPAFVYDRELRAVEYFWSGERTPWGIAPDALVGRRVGEVFNPEQAAPFDRALREVFETGEPRLFEDAFDTPAGVGWFESRLSPISAANGEVEYVLAVTYDVTERRRAENALRESEHRLHSLAEAMPIGVWRTDREPNVVYANRRNWELLDVDPDDSENRGLHSLLGGLADRGYLESEERERLWNESARAVRDATLNPSYLCLRLADGSERYLRTLAVPEFDSAGTFVGHVGVTIDVTDLTRAQQELSRHRDDLGALVAERTVELERSYEALRRSERLAAVGTFAAGIAHQINNPVGAILLAGQFALEDPGNRARVETALRDITTDARHCGRIVRGVLEFAQGPTQDPRPCDLNQIVCACVRKLAVDCAERGAALRLELDAQLPPVAGSESALEQVLANLVYNSVEAAAREIVIGTRQAGEGIELVIRDDGCGIADENLDRIFDPLFTTRSSLGGTGLGLALARGVVEAHGGSIDVSSREAEGTQIIVRLESATSPAPARRPAS